MGKRPVRPDGLPRQAFTRKIIVSNNVFTGVESKISFFKKAEAANNRNYDSESNPLDSSEGGKIVALSAELFAPNYGTPTFNAFDANVLNTLAQLRNAGLITVKLGKDTVHEDTLSSVLPPFPTLFVPTYKDMTSGSPIIKLPDNNLINPMQAIGHETSNMWQKRSSQNIIPFEPAIPIKAQENLTVEVTFLGSVAGTFQAIAGYVLSFRMAAIVYTKSKKMVV
jgi:hypothetical protein